MHLRADFVIKFVATTAWWVLTLGVDDITRLNQLNTVVIRQGDTSLSKVKRGQIASWKTTRSGRVLRQSVTKHAAHRSP